MKPVIFDTGVIVAAFLTRDKHHASCAAYLASVPKQFRILPVTVLAEVSGMLETWPDNEAAFLASVKAGSFALEQIEPEDIDRMQELVLQYADFPLGGVDASVVAVAERLGISDIATLDHRHFHAVRPRHVTAFTLFPT